MSTGLKPPRTPPPAVYWPHSGSSVSQAKMARNNEYLLQFGREIP